MVVPNGGRQDPDPVYVDEETEEETKLTFTQDRAATVFNVVDPSPEGVFLMFQGRYVIQKTNKDGDFMTLVLARKDHPKPERFLSFQRV